MAHILEILDNFKVFNWVLKAVKEGGLEAMFQFEGDFTVFAPIDSAFDNMKPELRNAIFSEPSNMMNLMLYHAVEWALDSRALSEAKKLRTLGEDTITVKAKKGTIKINDATVLKADIEAENGIIHMIDTVLLHPEVKDLI